MDLAKLKQLTKEEIFAIIKAKTGMEPKEIDLVKDQNKQLVEDLNKQKDLYAALKSSISAIEKQIETVNMHKDQLETNIKNEQIAKDAVKASLLMALEDKKKAEDEALSLRQKLAAIEVLNMPPEAPATQKDVEDVLA